MDGANHRRLVDVLKGAAILGVLAQHALSPATLRAGAYELHVGQAVPVFVLLMGCNAAGALRRRSVGPIGSAAWWTSRARRLLPPLAVVLGISLVWTASTGFGDLGPAQVLGFPSVPGPGGYFIPVLLQFTLLGPVLWRAMGKRPVATLLAMVLVDAAFELVVVQRDLLDARAAIWYTGCSLRYFGVFGFGLWLARGARSRRADRIVLLAMAASAAYLVLVVLDAPILDPLPQGFPRITNVFGATLPAGAVSFLLRRDRSLPLPAAIGDRLAWLGRLSLHVFLVQILWFVTVDRSGWIALLAAVPATAALAWCLQRIEATILRGFAVARRRVAGVAEPIGVPTRPAPGHP